MRNSDEKLQLCLNQYQNMFSSFSVNPDNQEDLSTAENLDLEVHTDPSHGVKTVIR